MNTSGNKSESKSKKGTNICVRFAGQIYFIPHMYITITKTEVHHIVSLEQDFDKRLDDDTHLITLCAYHHHLAEIGAIPIEILQMLTPEDVDFKIVKEKTEKMIPCHKWK